MYDYESRRKKIKKIEWMKDESSRHEMKHLNALSLQSECVPPVCASSVETHVPSDAEGLSRLYRSVSLDSPSPPILLVVETSPVVKRPKSALALQRSSLTVVECMSVDPDDHKEEKENSPLSSPSVLRTVSFERDKSCDSTDGADSSLVLNTQSEVDPPDDLLSIPMTPDENSGRASGQLHRIPPNESTMIEVEKNLRDSLHCSSSACNESAPHTSENTLNQKTIGFKTLNAIPPGGAVGPMATSYSDHKPMAMMSGHYTIQGVAVPPIVGIPRTFTHPPQQSDPNVPKQKSSACVAAPQRKAVDHSRVEKSSHVPRDFDVFVRLGQARRTQVEAQERQSRERDADELRFRPQISHYAAQRRPRTAVEFIDYTKVWEQRRQQRIQSAAERAERAERAEPRRACPVDPNSERIVKEMELRRRRVSAVAEPQRYAAARQCRLDALHAQYAPAFRPVVTDLAQRIRKPSAPGGGAGDSAGHFAQLYERLMLYRAAAERRREQRVAAAEAAAEAERAPTRQRSCTYIAAHVQRMALREEERRSRARRYAKEAEAEAARAASRPRVSARSAELAERHRQREREKLKDAQSAKHNKDSARSRNNNNNNNSSTMARASPWTNRKLAFSPPLHRSVSRATVFLLAADFEERNAELLRRRELYCEARRREEEEAIARECTFHPVINRNIGFSGGGRDSWPADTPLRDALSNEADMDWEERVRYAKRISHSLSNCSTGFEGNGDDEFALQIKSLEEMLTQWKQLEEEYHV